MVDKQWRRGGQGLGVVKRTKSPAAKFTKKLNWGEGNRGKRKKVFGCIPRVVDEESPKKVKNQGAPGKNPFR